MPDSPSGSGRFFRELKRRKVFRVAAVYAIVAFVVVQVADIVFPALRFPDWTLGFVVVLALLGFPIALVLAWAFEITPEGVKRTAPEAAGAGPSDPLPDTTGAGERAHRRTLIGFAAGILVALVGLGAASWFLVFDNSDESPAGSEAAAVEPSRVERSVAVLPFDNLSPEAENQYFADGVGEAIRDALANLGELTVTSRTSVLRYRDTEKSLQEIAGELDVANVVEGTVQWAGDRVRITAQLIDARQDRHLWSDQFDREYSTGAIFDIQSEIARRVAAALETELTGEERRRLDSRPTANLAAYDLFLRAIDHQERRFVLNQEGHREAIPLLRQALELDPDFALARARLAVSYAVLGWFTGSRAWWDSTASQARRALETDPELPEGHLILGLVHGVLGDVDRAVRRYRRALELRPNFAWALWDLHAALAHRGRLDEALRLSKKAVEVEPANPRNYNGVAWTYRDLGAFDRAARWFREALQVQPDHPWSYRGLALIALRRENRKEADSHLSAFRSLAGESPVELDALAWLELQLGQLEEAESRFRRVRTLVSDRGGPPDREPPGAAPPIARTDDRPSLHLWDWPIGLGYIYSQTDEPERARQALEHGIRAAQQRLAEGDQRWDAQMHLLRAHAILGEPEAAIDYLRQAIERGWRNYYRTGADPTLDVLRDHPEYQRLMGEVKAEVDGMRERVLEGKAE